MNKARRHELKMLKYKKRIQRFAASLGIYVTRSGEHIRNPRTIDVLKDNGQHRYRTMSTPCSCSMCAYRKYNRAQAKREAQQSIQL